MSLRSYKLAILIFNFHALLKNTARVKFVISLGFISSLLLTTNLYAAAGDSITSTATVSYDIGGIPRSTNAAVTFVEDRRLNFVVSAANGGAAVPVITDMVNAVMQFTVTNTGNSTQDFLLTAKNTSPNPFGFPVKSFDSLTMQVFVEGGAEPGNGYLPSQDTGIYIDELMPNQTKTVYVVSALPTLSADDVAAVALVAQFAEGNTSGVEGAFINADDNGHISPAGTFSNTNTNMPVGIANSIADSPLTMETVFNDPAGLDSEDVSTATPNAQDVVTNGQHSDTGAYQVMSPVTIVKTVTIIDAAGDSNPYPGSTLRYQLDVSVTGNTSIDQLVINDNIPANTTYAQNSIILNGVAQTDADDAADFSRAKNSVVPPTNVPPIISIEIDLGENGSVSIAPGTTNTIIFEVTIN